MKLERSDGAETMTGVSPEGSGRLSGGSLHTETGDGEDEQILTFTDFLRPRNRAERARVRDATLPLFAWKPPCKIAAFPVVRRVDLVRSTAKALLRGTAKQATIYWQRTIFSLNGELEDAGIRKDDIRIELRAFFDAVQEEMLRLAARDQGTPA